MQTDPTAEQKSWSSIQQVAEEPGAKPKPITFGTYDIKIVSAEDDCAEDQNTHKATGVRPGEHLKVGVYETANKIERYFLTDRKILLDESFPKFHYYTSQGVPVNVPDNFDKTQLIKDEYWVELNRERILKKRKTQLTKAKTQQKGISESTYRNTYYKLFNSQMRRAVSSGFMPPALQDIPLQWCEETNMPSASALHIGGRCVQQDHSSHTHFSICTPDGWVNYQLFAVLDGHGEKAEEFVKDAYETLQGKIQAELSVCTQKMYREVAENCALKGAFVDTSISIRNSDKLHNGQKCGATACILLIRDKKVIAANLGDTRAICVDESGSTTQLTVDAKAGDSQFEKSIMKRGGIITNTYDGQWRIGNRIAPARSFGCGIFTGISARPKISEFDLGDGEKTLVLASDGIWDYATSDQIGKLVHNLRQQGCSQDIIARAIVHFCFKAAEAYKTNAIPAPKDFPDNMSVIVIFTGENEHPETAV